MTKFIAIGVLLLSSACAHRVAGPPPEYIAAIDVSCFLYAIEHSADDATIKAVHKKCFAGMTKAYMDGIK